ncbi:hypothetical protein, partial [Mycobacterium tuberculosis]|uniref:hypothetical protein n=1 Tax=Mycobacterium tuberculosis TaxID=1773 RepID=UPI001AE4159B
VVVLGDRADALTGDGQLELRRHEIGLINTQMYNSPGIFIALLFITVGIGFKVSQAPCGATSPA